MKRSIQSTAYPPNYNPQQSIGYNAIYDYTIIDKVRDNYRDLQAQQKLINATKQQPKKKWWEIWN